MQQTVHIKVHTIDSTRVAEIRALAESESTSEEVRTLAQAVVDLDQSVHDLLAVLQIIAKSVAPPNKS